MAEDNENTLVGRRPKRSTAGNRMEAALAEFHAEELGQDLEEDNDFVMQVDEQDAFESDFESTDEEGAQEDVDVVAEKMVRDEETKGRKPARSQLDKITAVAHARQRATFNPEAGVEDEEHEKVGKKEKARRRVSMGVVVNAETGEVETLEGETLPEGAGGARKRSSRRHTMMNTSMTETKWRDEQEKKQAAAPRRPRTKVRPPTQDELIARALDMEEGNIREHREYLTIEEEKRKKARLVRESVSGPLLRYVSRIEEVKVKEIVQPQPMPPPPTISLYSQATNNQQQGHPNTIAYTYSSHDPIRQNTGYAPHPYAYVPLPTTSHYPYASYPRSQSSTSSSPYSSRLYGYPPPQPVGHVPSPSTYASLTTPQPPQPPAPLPEPVIVERTEKVSVGYLIHEASQSKDARKPAWKDTMAALFGRDIKWDQVRTYGAGKNRPLSQLKDLCTISGQQAKYKDPRTGVPFADAAAYRVLTKILQHKAVWNETLGGYVAMEDDLDWDSDVDMDTR